jgi:hypothetical protein
LTKPDPSDLTSQIKVINFRISLNFNHFSIDEAEIASIKRLAPNLAEVSAENANKFAAEPEIVVRARCPRIRLANAVEKMHHTDQQLATYPNKHPQHAQYHPHPALYPKVECMFFPK